MFLKTELPILMEDIPLDTRRKMWYQHDGCPSHYAMKSRAALDKMFCGRWIGRGGPVNWPARSPDLSLLDFFLWGKLKAEIYSDAPTTPNDMQQRILASFIKINQETLRLVQASLHNRMKACIEVNGHHFEHRM